MSSVQCHTILADGRAATISATCRPRANRAEVKCLVPGAPQLAEAMQAAVRLARLTEPRFDSRDQVVLSIDHMPGPEDRNWELAAVLADRMARGVWQAASGITAVGWSDQWQRGEISGDPARAMRLSGELRQAGHDGELLLGGAAEDGQAVGGNVISHLGMLSGQPHPGAGVASARSWFPLHSGGINDTLAWVEVHIHPLQGEAPDEESTISAPQLDLAGQQAVRQVLAGARHFDGKGLGRWRSAVRFGQARFQGESWQLALVMADRLARGREFVQRGRLIATGSSSAWHSGRVETVQGLQPKLELIASQCRAGDRVLLPRAWEAELPPGYGARLRARGASLACVERLGWS